MEQNNQTDNFLTQFFQHKRDIEGVKAPPFLSIYEKAYQKHIKMKRTKWLVYGILLVIVLLISWRFDAKDAPIALNEVTVAQGSLRLYDRLLKEGKIVTNDIHFDFDKASIRPSSMAIIDSIAVMMKAHPAIRLSVEGHSDNQGTSTYNVALSAARAAAVKQALIELSIAPQRLISKGYGESKPLVGNDTEQGRAKNRRVEFVLLQ